jgi:hypothetical protein
VDLVRWAIDGHQWHDGIDAALADKLARDGRTLCRCESPHSTLRFTARSAEEAARLLFMGRQWESAESTCWIPVYARLLVTGEESIRVFPVHPTEPACSAPRRAWQHAPEASKPAIERVACGHCGAVRMTDTDARDPHTGRRGLNAVRYETRAAARRWSA